MQDIDVSAVTDHMGDNARLAGLYSRKSLVKTFTEDTMDLVDLAISKVNGTRGLSVARGV